ncbi:hypothetical protein [Terricaulis silvestris]|uniref:Uncharacterized protein n=1 Tax=Terricaulis silvestris TaxID=2686094 RepID=A0A6I6MWW3_9CAUL|nr:hypothetical protein [Terricaulis silvestris]QGZ95693.1 hypothetical protein DSM104635_02544 [Terricaulis silvestris]
MSLNKTLDRLFDEIRREAKRNPDFANRLDAVLQLHDSRRDVPDGVVEDVASYSPASGGGAERSEAEGRVAPAETPAPKPITAPAKTKKGEPAPDINPAGLYKREGEAALSAALQGQKLTALRALVTEHNLDPSGVTSTLTRDELAAHIVDQAKRRAERDEKMFDY